MAFLLTDLPFDVLQRVVIFAGIDTKTLLRVERACRALRDIVRNDKTWECVPVLQALEATLPEHISQTVEPLALAFFQSHREYACVTNAIRLSWKEQAFSEKNILVEEMGARQGQGLAVFVHRLCNRALFAFTGLDLEDHQLLFRADTLDTLAEITQESMIRILRRAHSTSCTVANATGQYPVLTVENLHHEAANFVFNQSFLYDIDSNVLELLPETLRDAIVRRLAHRAGIVKMTNEASDLAWDTLLHLILLLIRPASIELIFTNTCDATTGARRLLAANESVRTIPPLSKREKCDCCNEMRYIHTLVPQQIEDAAKSLGLPHKVYGDFWLLGGLECEMTWENTRNALIAKAEEDYEFQTDDEEVEEEDLFVEYYECERESSDFAMEGMVDDFDAAMDMSSA